MEKGSLQRGNEKSQFREDAAGLEQCAKCQTKMALWGPPQVKGLLPFLSLHNSCDPLTYARCGQRARITVIKRIPAMKRLTGQK